MSDNLKVKIGELSGLESPRVAPLYVQAYTPNGVGITELGKGCIVSAKNMGSHLVISGRHRLAPGYKITQSGNTSFPLLSFYHSNNAHQLVPTKSIRRKIGNQHAPPDRYATYKEFFEEGSDEPIEVLFDRHYKIYLIIDEREQGAAAFAMARGLNYLLATVAAPAPSPYEEITGSACKYEF